MPQSAAIAKTAIRKSPPPQVFRAGFGVIADVLSPVLVEKPGVYPFDGAIAREHAEAIWTWVARDLLPVTAERLVAEIESGASASTLLGPLIPEVTDAIDEAIRQAKTVEADHRMTVQMGGDGVRERLPVFLAALRAHAVIARALDFGRVANETQDEEALGAALKSMPLADSGLTSLMMMAVVGQVANPSRLVVAAIRQTGAASDAALSRGGFGPLIEAILAHAQAQLAILQRPGVLDRDADLVCKAIDRFHRLIRAATGYIEVSRANIWAHMVADLTGRVSGQLEARLRGVTGEINRALRRPREGVDRFDPDAALAAYGGLYLLNAVRDARSSLALNVVFDQVWNESGQAIEVLTGRALESFRDNPAGTALGERLDAGIRMAEIRFDEKYAEILRRARDAAVRRLGGLA